MWTEHSQPGSLDTSSMSSVGSWVCYTTDPQSEASNCSEAQPWLQPLDFEYTFPTGLCWATALASQPCQLLSRECRVCSPKECNKLAMNKVAWTGHRFTHAVHAKKKTVSLLFFSDMKENSQEPINGSTTMFRKGIGRDEGKRLCQKLNWTSPYILIWTA